MSGGEAIRERAPEAGGEPGRLSIGARLLAAALRLAGRAIARVEFSGLEHVPRSGSLLVVANHLSNVDPPLIAARLQPVLGRPVRFLAKEQLFRTPLGPLLRALGSIPVRAGGSDVAAYRAARAALERGEVVAVFPEGTRSPTGRLGRAHPGAGLLALRAGVPILPIGIDGTDRLLPRGARLPRVGTRIRVRIGPPFSLAPDPGAGRREEVAGATERIMGAIGELLPPGRREGAAGPR